MSAIGKGLLAVALVAAPAIALAQQPPTSIDKGREVYQDLVRHLSWPGQPLPGDHTLSGEVRWQGARCAR